jgi:hypothetical protein
MYMGWVVLGRLKCMQPSNLCQSPVPSASEVDVAIGELKRYKSPGVDQIPAELIQARGETLHLEIRKCIKLIWDKEELPHQWKESVVVLIHKKGVETDCSN